MTTLLKKLTGFPLGILIILSYYISLSFINLLILLSFIILLLVGLFTGILTILSFIILSYYYILLSFFSGYEHLF